MTKKDYIAAARIVRNMRYAGGTSNLPEARAEGAESAFIYLFSEDNPRFDVQRFREACTSGSVFPSRKSFDKAREGS